MILEDETFKREKVFMYSPRLFSCVHAITKNKFNQIKDEYGLFKRLFQRKSSNVDNSTASGTYGHLLKPLLYSVGFTGMAFTGAAIWRYEDIRSRGGHWNQLATNYGTTQKVGEWRGKVNELWNKLNGGQKVFTGILFLNCLVFCGWRVPSLTPTLIKYFTLQTGKPMFLPMIGSFFSHYSPMHLGLNMFVLWSFVSPVSNALGKEQFLALYLSSGIFSSFFSYVGKAITVANAGLSLGASGAILGIFACCCLINPESRVSIVFLPFFSFSAAIALKSLIVLDVTGAIMKWKIFDHYAHLGGSMFGIFFKTVGQEWIMQKQVNFLKWYHEIRKG